MNTDPSLLDYFKKGKEPREGLEYVDRNGGSNPLTLIIASADGSKLDFAAEVRQRGQPYDDLLFRETVRAESPLVVEISAVYSADWLGKLLSKALGAAAGAAAGLLPVGTVGLAFLGSSTGALFERLGSQEKVHVIAKGFALLSPGMAAGDVTVDLSVPEDVTLWKAAPPPTSMGTKPPEDQQKTLRKNAPNGSVTVSVQLLDV